MLKPSITLFLATISACPHSAYADIYEYIDEAGISHYSDAPNNGTNDNDDYVLILKSELPLTSKVPLKSELAVAADNPNTTASTNSLTLTPPQLLAQIAQSAHNNQLDSELIHAVMHVESAYKVKAKSHKGAQEIGRAHV